jgi:hypothetical protein
VTVSRINDQYATAIRGPEGVRQEENRFGNPKLVEDKGK